MFRLGALWSLGVWLYSFVFVKQKTAYEMRISDWSSDVCSSDLRLILTRLSGGRTSYYLRPYFLLPKCYSRFRPPLLTTSEHSVLQASCWIVCDIELTFKFSGLSIVFYAFL